MEDPAAQQDGVLLIRPGAVPLAGEDGNSDNDDSLLEMDMLYCSYQIGKKVKDMIYFLKKLCLAVCLGLCLGSAPGAGISAYAAIQQEAAAQPEGQADEAVPQGSAQADDGSFFLLMCGMMVIILIVVAVSVSTVVSCLGAGIGAEEIE